MRKLLFLTILLSACEPKNECSCEKGSFFPEENECKVVLFMKDPCDQVKKQPVCGCDGETYDNACYANLAGVIQLEAGACPRR